MEEIRTKIMQKWGKNYGQECNMLCLKKYRVFMFVDFEEIIFNGLLKAILPFLS